MIDFQLRDVHQGFAVVKLATPYTVVEWDEMLRELKHREGGLHRLLIDGRGCEPQGPGAVQAMMAVWQAQTFGMLDGRAALVVGSDACAESARLAEEIANRRAMPFVLRTFRDMAAAERWLSEG